MTLLGPRKEVTIRALLDPGATVPVLSDKVVETLHIPTIRRKEPRLLSSWNSEVSKDAGALHTPELILLTKVTTSVASHSRYLLLMMNAT